MFSPLPSWCLSIKCHSLHLGIELNRRMNLTIALTTLFRMPSSDTWSCIDQKIYSFHYSARCIKVLSMDYIYSSIIVIGKSVLATQCKEHWKMSNTGSLQKRAWGDAFWTLLKWNVQWVVQKKTNLSFIWNRWLSIWQSWWLYVSWQFGNKMSAEWS